MSKPKLVSRITMWTSVALGWVGLILNVVAYILAELVPGPITETLKAPPTLAIVGLSMMVVCSVLCVLGYIGLTMFDPTTTTHGMINLMRED